MPIVGALDIHRKQITLRAAKAAIAGRRAAARRPAIRRARRR